MSEKIFMVSFDQNDYFGHFNSKEEAVLYGLRGAKGAMFYVGTRREPTPPEEIWSLDSWINEVINHEDYHGDYAEDYLCHISNEAEEEIQENIRVVLKDWLAKHELKPDFYIVDEVEEYIEKAGKAIKVSDE